jgi:hypothetical protein
MAECARSSHRSRPWQAFRGSRVKRLSQLLPFAKTASERSQTVANVQKVVKVMSLILLGDFLMHGVVLQNRVGSGRDGGRFYAKMFHVKHRCTRCFT